MSEMPVDKWLPLPGDGPTTTQVIALLREVTGRAQFVTRLIEDELLEVVALVRELEVAW